MRRKESIEEECGGDARVVYVKGEYGTGGE